MPTPQARTAIMIGDSGVALLRSKTVLVAGLGGVGGYCAEALARAGVGTMILLDHDVVSPSNLNRQLLALHSSLGQEKTALMAARIRDINPDCRVIIEQRFLRPEAAGELLATYPELQQVFDCIDSIACKAALVQACQRAGVPVISAMGAGNCLDPLPIRVKILNQTSHCPLARELRKALRERGADVHYPVVYSPQERRQPLPHQPIAGAVPGRSRAVNGTISYLPALFGLTMAGYVLQQWILAAEAEALPPGPE